MKLLIAFLKDKTREISLYAGTVGIFIVVAFLYNIRMDALKYALLLVILWLFLYVITEYHRFRKKHLLLERFKKSTQECTKELPECRNLLELDYQELLGIFDEKILELKSEARIKGQDLSDCYGMWAHQIKTPIAAMHILLQSVEDENPALSELKEMKMELFKMEQYVEMVLTYLRMEDMSGDLQFEKVSLDKILKQSVRKYSQMFIFQKIDTFSLKDNIFLPLVLSGKKYPEMEKRLKPIAEKLGIEKLLEKYPYEVSGGQKQRAAIARALITKPQLILADEPSGALDSKAADSLMNLFTTINQEGQTIVMVTHSVKAASSAKRVLFIKDGKVFHQLYRGNLTNEEMYERISDTLKILTTGGEEDE